MKSKHTNIKIALFSVIIFVFTGILNLLSWNSSSFCDFYTGNIFPWISSCYSLITGIFPFSVGEWLLIIGAALVLLYIIFCIIVMIAWIFYKCKTKNKENIGNTMTFSKSSFRWGRIYRRISVILLLIFSIVWLIMTLNCFIQYHCSDIGSRTTVFTEEERVYTLEDLENLRNYLVVQANELSESLPRDENGQLIYEGDVKQQAIEEMKALQNRVPQMEGYFPKPKSFFFSEFFSQQYIMGYYFPFSMEANYNGVMATINLPTTMCHELSHLKGFIYEDEANFIGYLACEESEDDFFRYSAYLSVLGYVEKDYVKAINHDSVRYMKQPMINSKVKEDDVFLTEESWAEVEEKAVFDTDMVKEASSTFLETSLNANGVSDGILSYSRVVGLLLRYYS